MVLEMRPQSMFFSAVEKPLLYEICTLGLWRGAKYINDPNIAAEALDPQEFLISFPESWDNVHWWGSRGVGQPLISEIGAFHAAQIHWRWALHVQSWPAKYSQQFQGPVPARGGPLLDPKLPEQTIRFAIAKYREERDPDGAAVDYKDLSRERFSDLFHNKNSPPPQELNKPLLPTDFPGFVDYMRSSSGSEAPLYLGDDIVLWFSIEVETPTGVLESNPPSIVGTLFAHGFFFAHNPEPSEGSFAALKTGSRDEEYWPHKPKAEWLRLYP